jgi:hypothetical protein
VKVMSTLPGCSTTVGGSTLPVRPLLQASRETSAVKFVLVAVGGRAVSMFQTAASPTWGEGAIA